MLDQTKINIGQTYWLTNIGSSVDFNFTGVYEKGHVEIFRANATFGVRPFACIVGDSE